LNIFIYNKCIKKTTKIDLIPMMRKNTYIDTILVNLK